MKKFCLVKSFLIISVLTITAHAQSISFDSDRWEINARESRVTDHLGRKSLFLKGGSATVKDSRFTDGIIEFDIAFTGERGFMGTIWRVQDATNYEEFYIRPHQSGNPDANQYTPVFNGLSAWQLYYGEEYAAPVVYDFNKWIHVKILVAGNNAEVYIKDMEKPALFVNELKRPTKSGRVGLSAGNFAPAHFSNFSFKAMNNPPLKGKAKEMKAPPTGTIRSWMVSNTFDEKSLDKKYLLTRSDKETLKWNKIDCESSGTVNLARLQGISQGHDTAFAKVTIVSATEQVKKLQFGFSDRVKAYFNDRLIYGGTDIYQSRDYRFLGTIGYFDELYLPLKKGENELWIAVSESFGGWGIKAMFEDMEGIEIKE